MNTTDSYLIELVVILYCTKLDGYHYAVARAFAGIFN
jgi:hypothetical protein